MHCYFHLTVQETWKMVSWATSKFLSNQFIPISAVVTAAAAPCSSCSTNFLKVCSPRSGMYGLSVAESHSRVRAYAVNSNQASSMQIRPGTWEDPDNGSGSEYDEDDEGEENDWGHESDWEEEIDASATTNVDKSTINTYEEDLVKGSYSTRTSCSL